MRDFFPASTSVKGGPVGGWFVPGDAPDQAPQTWNPPSLYPDWSAGKVTPWSAAELDPWKAHLNEGCVQALGVNAGRCQSVHTAYPYVKTPLYVMENNYDTNQLGHFGLKKTMTSEQAQNYVRYYGRAMRNSTAQVAHKAGDVRHFPARFPPF